MSKQELNLEKSKSGNEINSKDSKKITSNQEYNDWTSKQN
jgi:hypothetical protein